MLPRGKEESQTGPADPGRMKREDGEERGRERGREREGDGIDCSFSSRLQETPATRVN